MFKFLNDYCHLQHPGKQQLTRQISLPIYLQLSCLLQIPQSIVLLQFPQLGFQFNHSSLVQFGDFDLAQFLDAQGEPDLVALLLADEYARLSPTQAARARSTDLWWRARGIRKELP